MNANNATKTWFLFMAVLCFAGILFSLVDRARLLAIMAVTLLVILVLVYRFVDWTPEGKKKS